MLFLPKALFWLSIFFRMIYQIWRSWPAGSGLEIWHMLLYLWLVPQISLPTCTYYNSITVAFFISLLKDIRSFWSWGLYLEFNLARLLRGLTPSCPLGLNLRFLVFSGLSCPLKYQHPISEHQLESQLLFFSSSSLLMCSKDSPETCTPVNHVGDQDGVPGYWCRLGLALAIAVSWSVNQMAALFLCHSASSNEWMSLSCLVFSKVFSELK